MQMNLDVNFPSIPKQGC